MATTNASQRDKVIQKAKFPPKKPITAYQVPKREIQRFLSSGKTDTAFFDLPKSKLEYIIQTDEEKRAEARRDLNTLNAFIDLYRQKRWSKVEMGLSKVDIQLMVETVPVNVRLDVALTETVDDVRWTGGIVLFLAQTAEARKHIEERRRQVAQLILWALEGHGNLEPLPRLCMSMDVFGRDLVKATEVSERFRGYARAACREAALKWDDIPPPPKYDGPTIRKGRTA